MKKTTTAAEEIRKTRDIAVLAFIGVVLLLAGLWFVSELQRSENNNARVYRTLNFAP